MHACIWGELLPQRAGVTARRSRSGRHHEEGTRPLRWEFSLIARPIVCKPFIGRRAELAYLQQRQREAGMARGGLILLSGDAGIGKTRLLAEFRLGFAKSRTKVATGHCVEFAQHPYGPIVDALLALDLDASAISSAASKWERFDAVATAFERAAERRTIVLIFEDVHWADQATVELLVYLAGRVANRRMLIVASYRGEVAGVGHPLLASLGKLQSAPRVAHIALSAFDAQESQTFIDEALAGAGLPADVRLAVSRASEGNPFFLEELLKSAVASGSASLPAAELPTTVRAALLERWHPLSPSVRRILGQAAVIGRRFELRLLAETLNEDDAAVLAALAQAHACQLIEEESPTAFRFRHALTREAIYTGFLQAQRRQIHRDVATVLERLPQTERSPELLAYHWEAAGSTTRAAFYHDRAGDAASDVYAHDDAITHFTRAITSQALSPLDTARLRAKIGSHHFSNGSFAAARIAYDHAADIFRAQGRSDDEIAVSLQITRCNYLLGEPAPATRIEEILERFPITDTSARERLRISIGSMYAACWRPAIAQVHLDLVSLEHVDGDAAMQFAYHNSRALVAALRGDAEAVRAHHCNARAAARRNTQTDGDAPADANAGLYLAWCGHPREGLALIGHGLQASRERATLGSESRGHALAAYAHLLLGELPEVRRELERVNELPTDNAMVVSHAAAWGTWAGLHLHDDALIERWFDRTREDVCENGLRFFAAPFAEVLVRRGRPIEAQALLRRALDQRCSQRGTFGTYVAIARFGANEDIEIARAGLEAEAEAPDVPERAALALFRAYAARRAGQDAQLSSYAREAAEGFRRFAYPLWEAASLELAGDLDGARSLYELAGAVGDLRRLNGPVDAVMPASPGPRPDRAPILSLREYEVAVLVAEGCSNLETARRLAISHKTVEKHLGSIYRKLQSSSRANLATFIARRSTAESA